LKRKKSEVMGLEEETDHPEYCRVVQSLSHV